MTYESGRDVLAAIYERHHAEWHETLTFVQQSIFHRPDGAVDTATWYEAEGPGRPRTDVAPIEAGKGMIFRDGQRHTFRDGAGPDGETLVGAYIGGWARNDGAWVESEIMIHIDGEQRPAGP